LGKSSKVRGVLKWFRAKRGVGQIFKELQIALSLQSILHEFSLKYINSVKSKLALTMPVVLLDLSFIHNAIVIHDFPKPVFQIIVAVFVVKDLSHARYILIELISLESLLYLQ
jgi:hypothetical protein